MITENPPAETSMDEILASIRKIIAADAQAGIHVETPSFFSPDESEDILDLTNAIPEDSPKMQPPIVESEIHVNELGEWSPYADKSIYVDDIERDVQNVSKRGTAQGTVQGAAYVTPPYETITPTVSEEPLLSQATMTEAMHAFQTLQTLEKEKSAADGPRFQENTGGQALENLMKEMLKPLLKEWLDANLPVLVRSIVQEQVEKIVGQKR
jgi:hypothetical protein